MAIETPNYKVIKKSGRIEIREYQPYLKASVYVDSDSYNSAGSYAFSVLADYIFGNNTKSGKIPMTAPVDTQMSEQIPMTAPVDTTKSKGQYKVSFTMPSSYSLKTLPKPNNNDVIIEQVPKRKMATIIFSGYTPDEKVNKKLAELNNWLEVNKLKVSGEPILSRFDSPIKPGFIRHNELSLKIS
jgi:effector-binding domain-containing protein